MSAGNESVFRPALLLMTGRVAGFLAAFIIPVILARVFDQAEFGTYKQLFLVYSTLFGVAQIGMAESLFYFLPDDESRGGRYILNALLMLGGVGCLCLGLLWLLQPEVARLLNNDALIGYLPYLGLYLLFMLMAVVMEIVMIARKRHFAASCTYAVSDFSRAVLYLTPVLLFGTLQWLLVGAVVFAAGRFCAALFYLRREFPGGLRPDAGRLQRHLGYALPFGMAAVIEIVQMNFHLYAVSHYFDAARYAVYAVGCLQIPLVDFLMTSTANVMMVNMRENIREGNSGAVLKIWQDTTRKLALVFFPLVGGLLVTAHSLIVLLFTDTYERSVPIFMVWSLMMLFSTLLTDGVLRVYAENRFLIVQNLVRLGVIVVLIQWFLARFDLIGAVLVTLLATAVARVLALVRLSFILQSSLSRLLPWGSLLRLLIIVAIAAVPALLVRSALAVSGLPALLVIGLIYVLSYYFLLLLCGPMHKEEKSMLRYWTRMPLSHVCRIRRA